MPTIRRRTTRPWSTSSTRPTGGQGSPTKHTGPMAEYRLQTERLVLRDWRPEDWPGFFRHTNTLAIMRWLGDLLSDQQQAAMRERVADCAARHGHCFWA